MRTLISHNLIHPHYRSVSIVVNNPFGPQPQLCKCAGWIKDKRYCCEPLSSVFSPMASSSIFWTFPWRKCPSWLQVCAWACTSQQTLRAHANIPNTDYSSFNCINCCTARGLFCPFADGLSAYWFIQHVSKDFPRWHVNAQARIARKGHLPLWQKSLLSRFQWQPSWIVGPYKLHLCFYWLTRRTRCQSASQLYADSEMGPLK